MTAIHEPTPTGGKPTLREQIESLFEGDPVNSPEKHGRLSGNQILLLIRPLIDIHLKADAASEKELRERDTRLAKRIKYIRNNLYTDYATNEIKGLELLDEVINELSSSKEAPMS